MVFSSVTFLIAFLPLVIAFYFLSKNAVYRNVVLLVFSLLFYAWGEPKWILVMLLTVGTNYLSGIRIAKAKSHGAKTVWMLLGVSLSIAFLFYFKYCGFLWDMVTGLFGLENQFNAPVLPIGISFYTFQVLTYTIDVYRGKANCQKNFLHLLLYVSFFPQLIAGPIVNYKDIEGQLEKRTISLDNFYQGFLRFLIGFNKKILIANTCGELTEKLTEAGEFSVTGAWTLAIAYTLQIYFDFSGYSDMAIGMGRMFGFHFLENFNYPYCSKSITEFWRRWHISLGAFFRDYVYIPLGGNRVKILRQITNILVVWMLTGVWHGASWNFIVWGLYYGVLLIIEKVFLIKYLKKLPRLMQRIYTLLLVVIGWVFFYFVDLKAGITHLKIMFGFGGAEWSNPASVYYFKYYAGFLGIGVLASIAWKRIFRKTISNKRVDSFLIYLKPILVTLLFFLALSMLVGQSYNPFLYFRF